MMRFTIIMWETLLVIANNRIEGVVYMYNLYDKAIDKIDEYIKKKLNIK